MPIQKKCLVCNKLFNTYPYYIKHGWGKYCSSTCLGKAYKGKHHSPKTEFKKGQPSLNKGKQFPSRSKENHPNWKGGKYKAKSGYIMIRKNGKYFLEHRLIIEKKLGRPLTSKEIVHHINEIKWDNRIKNLMLFGSAGKHTAKAHPKKTMKV